MREPLDEIADRVYEEIGQMAREACLVVEAYGGYMVIMSPAAQRKAGVRERVLRAHGVTNGLDILTASCMIPT